MIYSHTVSLQYCQNTKEEFEITPSDLTFYSRMGVPSPHLCPDERRRQRLMFRNERNLYRRLCDATGKTIVSIHDQDAPFPVYSQNYWWSDHWDALSFGQPMDFSRPFFEQFAEVYRSVPQIALNNSRSENCEYTNQAENNKDCYLVFCSNASRNCYYGMWYQHCNDCVDCLYLESSELCYEVLNGERCYHCVHCENIQNCHDCYFCIDCIGCRNCIGCSNLRNKSYFIDNVAHSKKDFEEKLSSLKLGTRNNLTSLEELYRARFKDVATKYYIGKNCETFSGSYLQNVKNTHQSFNCRHTENLSYCQDAWDARNCLDLTETLATDFCYQVEGSERINDCAFGMKQSRSDSTWYCSHCYSSSSLFGCVGLNNKSFCILNRCYEKEEYHTLRDRIISHMKHSGEWGHYFPEWIAPFPYNKTVAQEYYPLTREEALRKGYRWKDEDLIPAEQNNTSVLTGDITECGDEVLAQSFNCKISGKPFRITKAELEFYRKLGLGLPLLHHDQRHQGRMARRAPRRLVRRPCRGCGGRLETTFSEDRQGGVLCDRCYSAVVL